MAKDIVDAPVEEVTEAPVEAPKASPISAKPGYNQATGEFIQ